MAVLINVEDAESSQPNVTGKISYGTINAFRQWISQGENSFFLSEINKSGLFNYDPTDNTSTDDGIMTLIKDSKRFKRQVDGFVSVDWFGAVADGVETSINVWSGTDNTAAIQKAFDWSQKRGMALMFSEGTYIVENTLKPKRIDGKHYSLTICGKGQGVSEIRGKGDGLINKNLIEFAKISTDQSGMFESKLMIRDISFSAGKADMAFYGDYLVHPSFSHCDFKGGKTGCFQLGTGVDDVNQYGGYIYRCYFNGVSYDDNHNQFLMKVSNYYAEIYRNVGDGSRCGLITNGVQTNIDGNTFEGYKYAGILMESSGGGRNKIISNQLRPYAGYEKSGLFNGTIYGIKINSISGGVYSNIIKGNQIFMPMPEDLDIVAIVETGFTITPSPHLARKVTGATSGAEAFILGYDSAAKRIHFKMITTNINFVVGENLTQAGTTGTGKISSFMDRHSYGIYMSGSNGGNTVTANVVEAEWGICSYSINNNITANEIGGTHNGIDISSDGLIVANTIKPYGPNSHISIRRTAGNVICGLNSYSGTLEGITAEFSGEDFIKKSGDQVLLGTLMMNSFSANSAKTSGSGGFQIKADGVTRWSFDRFTPEAATGNDNNNSHFGIGRYNDAGQYVDTPFQIDRKSGAVYFLKFPVCDNLPTVGNQLVNKNYVDSRKALNVADMTPSASGSGPTAAEFNTQTLEIRAIKNALKVAGLMFS